MYDWLFQAGELSRMYKCLSQIVFLTIQATVIVKMSIAFDTVNTNLFVVSDYIKLVITDAVTSTTEYVKFN